MGGGGGGGGVRGVGRGGNPAQFLGKERVKHVLLRFSHEQSALAPKSRGTSSY